MTDTGAQSSPSETATVAATDPRLRRFSLRLMAAMIMACNLLILLGVWLSGINPDALFKTPDHFNQSRDICLRYSWHKVAGVQRPVRLCYEWINLSDPSGNTHTFQADVEIVMGADGKLHYGQGDPVDTRLALLLAFAGAVVVTGIALTRRLIERYRRQLDQARTDVP
jgi:hypothetical protein